MAITNWPEHDRPREKLLAKGCQTLSDAELLAIFLRTGCKGSSAVELARQLLADFGSLRALFSASKDKFCSQHGLGTASYAQLQAVLEMARRHFFEELKAGEQLQNPDHTKRYLQARMSHYQQEVFACLFLDNQHQVIEIEELFFGSIDSASVYPREVVKKVLHFNAAAVIFAHNHPSGIAEPSQADRLITDQLKQALGLIDVRVLDHIVVGHNNSTSFAERGLI